MKANLVDYQDWLAELILYADDVSPQAAIIIAKYPFMYEDYYVNGLTCQEAFEAEWG